MYTSLMRLATATYCNKMHVDGHRFWLINNPQHHWLVSAMGRWADPERGGGGTGGPEPPWKITKIYSVLAIFIRIPYKSQRYQASIQWWAIIGMPAKRHSNGVSLAGRWWPILVAFQYSLHPINWKKKTLSVLDPLWQNFLDQRMGVNCFFLID